MQQSKVKQIKRDFSRRNSIIYKEYEFLKEYGCRPNELRVSIDFYNEMSSDVEIAFDIIFNEDLTKSYRDMNIIIDTSIEGFEVGVNEQIIIKEDEILDFNGFKFKCLIEQLSLPKIISKQYLLGLCSEGELEELK
jgi:hypothetical protein